MGLGDTATDRYSSGTAIPKNSLSGPLRLTRTKTEPLPDMNIDLLQFTSFALESTTAAASVGRQAQTLTLPLGLVPVHAAFGSAMAGTASVEMSEADPGAPCHAAVVNAVAAGLTITF